jgi:glutamine amidotransferase
MSNIIEIVNYAIAGNIHSIKKAIEKAGAKTLIINSPKQFSEVSKIVLPGIGSFKGAMEELENNGFLESLKTNTKPILGVCLGMQILATIGYEYGKTQGLGLIDAKVPHVGFNKIDIICTNKILNGLEDEEFYFMHSYIMVNFHDVSSTTTYINHQFVSSIKKNNIYGVQFHPEKSREAGIKLFKNFIQLGAI